MPARQGENHLGKIGESWVEKIEAINADIATITSNAMLACKGKRRQIRDALKAAKDDGVEVDVLKGIVEHRKLDAKIQKIAIDFDVEERRQYLEISETLGLLGQAAAARAGYGETEADRKARAHEAGIGKVGRGPAAVTQ